MRLAALALLAATALAQKPSAPIFAAVSVQVWQIVCSATACQILASPDTPWGTTAGVVAWPDAVARAKAGNLPGMAILAPPVRIANFQDRSLRVLAYRVSLGVKVAWELSDGRVILYRTK